jgi:death on curing protein
MIRFLDKATLLLFHHDQMERYGGESGIRDESLLESALAQPQASFDGDYVHEDIFHMAAAYGYHLCRNHPYYDGNKRTALIAMYMFLYVNGYQIVADKKSLYAIILDLARGKVSKEDVRVYLKEHSKKRT